MRTHRSSEAGSVRARLALGLLAVLVHLQVSALVCPMGEHTGSATHEDTPAHHHSVDDAGTHVATASDVSDDGSDASSDHGTAPCAAMMACGVPAAATDASLRLALASMASMPQVDAFSRLVTRTVAFEPPPPRS